MSVGSVLVLSGFVALVVLLIRLGQYAVKREFDDFKKMIDKELKL